MNKLITLIALSLSANTTFGLGGVSYSPDYNEYTTEVAVNSITTEPDKNKIECIYPMVYDTTCNNTDRRTTEQESINSYQYIDP